MKFNLDTALIVAVLAAGSGAGALVDSNFWLITAVVAFILFAARRTAIERARDIAPGFDALPRDVQDFATETLDSMPDGAAAGLLRNVLRQASAIFAREGGDVIARKPVQELVHSACLVAIDVSRLDVALSSGRLKEANEGAFTSAVAARQLHARRLTDAASTLAALNASGLAQGTPESERVEQLVVDIREDAAIRLAAWAEVDSIMRRRSA